MVQGELEHRTPKSRYRRTSRKLVHKQLGAIERRHARIRRIRQSFDRRHKLGKVTNDTACTPEGHHHIGMSQNQPVELGAFLRKNSGDPAIKVLMVVCQHLATANAQ